MAARDELAGEGIAARVVSMPCWELFDRQPPGVPRRGAAALGQGAGGDRAGVDPRLGPLRRGRRRGDRDAHLRRLGAAEATARASSASPPTGSPSSPRARRGCRRVVAASARGPRPDRNTAGKEKMKATETLHERGQSLWLDNITRSMLDNGTIQRYIDDVLGDRADVEPLDLRQGDRLGRLRRRHPPEGRARACRARSCSSSWPSRTCAVRPTCSCPIHERTDGVDGWVSLGGLPAAGLRHGTDRRGRQGPARAGGAAQPVHQDPRDPRGPARHHGGDRRRHPGERHLAVLAPTTTGPRPRRICQGVERRIADGLDPAVGSVASVFMSRWDVAVAKEVPGDLADKLGLAVGLDVYRAYRATHAIRALPAAGERRGPDAAAVVGQHEDQGPRCVRHALCPRSGRTLHGQHHARRDPRGLLRPRRGGRSAPRDGGDADALLARFTKAGVDIAALAAKLQSDGAKSFVRRVERADGAGATPRRRPSSG